MTKILDDVAIAKANRKGMQRRMKLLVPKEGIKDTYDFALKRKKCIRLMTEMEGDRLLTQGEIAKKLGIHRHSIKNWLNDRTFCDELDKALAQKFANFNRHALHGLFQHIKANRYQAIKDYLQARGTLRERTVVETQSSESLDNLSEEELNKQLKEVVGELGLRHHNKRLRDNSPKKATATLIPREE